MALDHITPSAVADARRRISDLAADAREGSHGYCLHISHALDAVIIVAFGSAQWAPIAEVVLAECGAPWELVGIELSWVCGEGVNWRDMDVTL